MNFVSVKKSSDIKLAGITADCEWRDKQLSAVTLSDAHGGVVRLVIENYSVRALIPAPPEKKTVHVLAGAVPVLGTTIREEFSDKYDAELRKADLVSAGVIENASVDTEEVEIMF